MERRNQRRYSFACNNESDIIRKAVICVSEVVYPLRFRNICLIWPTICRDTGESLINTLIQRQVGLVKQKHRRLWLSLEIGLVLEILITG